MHIDHEKFVELLAETSGIEKEKVEKQLAGLVAEIREAIEEGEAYEVDDFGIFSGIGENIVFMPNKDLETEINYKYVGMEPIEMEEPAGSLQEKSEPEEEQEDDGYEDPFGIFEDDEESEESIPEETAPAAEDEKETTPVEEIADETESDEGAVEEAEEDAEPWGIDSYKDEESEDVFSGMLGETVDDYMDEEDLVEDSESTESEDEAGEPDLAEDLDAELELLAEEGDEDEDDKEPDMETAAIEVEEDKEEEDPFAALAESDDDDEIEEAEPEREKEEDIIPVIKNLSSKPKKKESGKETKPEEKDKKIPKSRAGRKREKGASPVLLVLIVILLLGGGAAALGYFGIINIPGITPEMASNTPSSPPANVQPEQPVENTPSQEAEEQTGPGNEEGAGIENEQPPESGTADSGTPDESEAGAEEGEEETLTQAENTPQTQNTEMETEMAAAVPAGQSEYGITGVPVESANDGYTIVLFSLTNEANAREKIRELSDTGYRALLDARSSAQYGTIWRVSIGQFESLRDAAIASERLEEPYASNYFITEIN